MLDTVSPNVLGVNFDLLTVKFCTFPVGLNTVMTTDVGEPVGTFPESAETGLNQVHCKAPLKRLIFDHFCESRLARKPLIRNGRASMRN